MNAFHYLLVLTLMLTLDAAWIGGNKAMYTNAVQAIQKAPLHANMLAVVLSYAFIYVGMVCIALPAITRPERDDPSKEPRSVLETLRRSVIYAGGLGLVVYGVYNATTKALLHRYPWKVAVADTVWGSFMFTAVSFLTLVIVDACTRKKGEKCRRLE